MLLLFAGRCVLGCCQKAWQGRRRQVRRLWSGVAQQPVLVLPFLPLPLLHQLQLLQGLGCMHRRC